jgi:hypothetical protein
MDSQLSKKIRLGRTKCTNIINNVLGPVITNECDASLKVKFFSILVDESTFMSVITIRIFAF